MIWALSRENCDDDGECLDDKNGRRQDAHAMLESRALY
jgi:hypothetical protein